MLRLFLLFSMLVFPCGSFALTTRIWASDTPECVEGTFRREMLGGVQIQDAENRSCLIRFEDLSIADLNYLKFRIPPKLSIKTDYSTRELPKTEWSREGDYTTFYTFNVCIEKKSRLPYKGRLTAELFVLGGERLVDDDSRLVLMSYFKKSFELPEEKKSQYRFSVPEIPFNLYRAGWVMVQAAVNRGKTYQGVIVAVSDLEGNLIASEHDLNVDWLTDDMPRSIQSLRRFYHEHLGSIEARHFNSSFEKLEPPRIPWFQRAKTH